MAELTRTRAPWRLLGWGGAATLLAVPFIAMRFTSDVNWSLGDFIFAGSLFAIIGVALELAVRSSSSWNYRFGAALALMGTLLTIWTNLAVGIVGSEENPANLWFFGALLIGILGSALARFKPVGMSIFMFATSLGLWAAFAIASLSPTDEPLVKHGVELLGTSVFALLFLASAAMFRKAARP